MRTINIKETIHAETFEPLGLIYLDEIFTGAKYSLDQPYHLAFLPADERQEIVEYYITDTIGTVIKNMPDVSDNEIAQLASFINNVMNRLVPKTK